ncbi:MAG: choice-of-anchor Q domain-containing protein [Bacteroidia bacterium]
MHKFYSYVSVLCALMYNPILSAATFTISNGNNSGTGSFRAAVLLASNNDVLVFAPNVDTVRLTGAIVLNKSLTVTTSGAEVCLTPLATPVRLMQVTSGMTVSLTNIHFANVNMLNSANPLQGLGMTNAGHVTLNNCQFKSLWSGANGAAMVSTISSSVKMNNCVFYNNRSEYGNGPAMVSAGTITAKNCLFIENHTDWGEGGALQGIFSGAFFLYQCHFVNNYGMMGGAIMTQNSSILHSHGCVYTGNHSASDGGAIFNQNITYSYGDIFENNLADYSGGAVANYSAIYFQNQGDSNVVFHANIAPHKGGAIVNYGSMTLTGSFGNGSAILPAQIGSSTSVTEGNFAQYGGGAICNSVWATCTLSGNVLIQNNLTDTLSGKGGAIFCDSLSSLTMQNGVVIKKNKGYAGGAIFNYYGGITMNQVKIRENAAKLTGGAIHSENIGGLNGGVLSFTQVEIGGNKVAPTGITGISGRFGGGLYLNGGAGTFSCVTLENNLAQYGSGAGMYAKAGNFTFNNSTFFGNSTMGLATTGGAIKTGNATLSALTLNLNNCTIVSNNAFGEGGGLHTSNYVHINNCIITGNSNHDLVGFFNSTLGHNIWNLRKTGLGSALAGNTIGNQPNKTYAQVFGGMTLAYNGAYTRTVALPMGSIAVNTGSTTLSQDQRGRLRDALPDVGAVELYINITTTPNSLSSATMMYMGSDGWQHYYNAVGELLLSLHFHGQTFGSISGANPAMTVSVGLEPETGSGIGQNLTAADYVALPGNGWFSMNRYWKVDVTNQPTDSVSVRFYYNQADYTDLANVANAFLPNTVMSDYNVRFFKVDNYHSPLSLNVPASAFHLYEYNTNPSLRTWKKGTSLDFSYAEFYVSSFSGGSGGASGNGGPLPVEWMKFDLHLAGERAVRLNWMTGAEVGNDKFVIERSEDGQHFEGVAEVAAVGYADGQSTYSYLDESLNYRKYYYRIKQIDIDGRYSYSDTKFILTDGAVLAYPSPTTGDLFISAGIERQSMTISDAAGHVVKNYKKVPEHLNISDLVPGVYYLRIGTETQAIIKE